MDISVYEIYIYMVPPPTCACLERLEALLVRSLGLNSLAALHNLLWMPTPCFYFCLSFFPLPSLAALSQTGNSLGEDTYYSINWDAISNILNVYKNPSSASLSYSGQINRPGNGNTSRSVSWVTAGTRPNPHLDEAGEKVTSTHTFRHGARSFLLGVHKPDCGTPVRASHESHPYQASMEWFVRMSEYIWRNPGSKPYSALLISGWTQANYTLLCKDKNGRISYTTVRSLKEGGSARRSTVTSWVH